MRRILCLCLLAACSTPAATPSGGLTDAAFSPDVKVLPSDAKASDGLTDTAGLYDNSAFTCTGTEVACFNDTIAKVCVNGGWVVKEKCPDGSTCVAGYCATPATCTAGESQGCEGMNSEKVCSDDGKSIVTKTCAGKQQCAAGKCQDVVCTPGIAECVGQVSFHTCTDDGQGYGAETPCKTGASCFGGKCVSLCESNLKIVSNIGCEYWSVDLDNDSGTNPANGVKADMVPHSVVLSNPGIYDAEITFTIEASCADGSSCSPSKTTCNGKQNTVCDTLAAPYDLIFADNKVPAGGSKEFKMPVMNVSGSSLAPKAIHVKSTQPVVAFQFNPFNSEGAASNDGSLLLPQNALGKTYYAVVPAQSRPALMGFPANNAFLTVVATQLGTTTVKVTPTHDCLADAKKGVAPNVGQTKLVAGTTYSFDLSQYDVLNIEEAPTNDIVPPGKGPQSLKNMTGTKIEGTKPIAVFSGHQVAGVEDDMRFGSSSGSDGTWDTCCTEHMEEQLMPVETWGNEAFCVKTKPRGDEVDEFVVVAGEAGVKLTTNPSIPGLDGVTINAGERARAQTDGSFMLTATGKIQVVQLLVSAGQTAAKSNGSAATLGDASMAIVPPKKQYRADYVIQTADGYNANYVSIVRPKGLAITLDGAAVPDGEFTAFGDGSWEYAYQTVAKGSHTVAAKDVAFGLMVYGYGGVTAYSYPGGMNLQ